MKHTRLAQELDDLPAPPSDDSSSSSSESDSGSSNNESNSGSSSSESNSGSSSSEEEKVNEAPSKIEEQKDNGLEKPVTTLDAPPAPQNKIEVKFAKIETTTDTDLTDVIPVKVKATLAPIPKINPSLTKTKEMQEYEKEEFYKRGDTRSQAKKDL